MNKIAKINVYILAVTLLLGVGQVFAAWSGDYSQAVRPDTADGYFLIKNEDNLAWISDSVDGVASKIKVKLMANLDMGGHSFIPLGAGKGDANAFGGIFDGNEYTIKNLFIHSDSLAVINNNYAQNIGFIGVLTGTLKNVSFDNVLIAASQDEGKIISGNASPISVGVAVGWMASGVVENVQTSGMITTSGKGQAVGGVVGYTEKYSNYSAPTINNCYSDVNIQTSGANVYVGGISGYTKSTVSISSVAFNGSIENSGTANAEGGIVGKIAGGTLTVNDCYYDSTAVSSGVAVGTPSGSTSGTDNLNTEDVVCPLNGGTWNKTTSTCTDETSDIWSVGQSDISINGSDGYTIVFSANGGSFASGAKTSKIVAKGASINADEISVPSRSGYFFAGWALSANATGAENLGTASAKDTVYAVWDAGYTVAFHSTPGVFSGNDSLKTIKVAKGGVVSVNGIEVPTTYTKNGVMYYFSGWTSAAAEESRLVEDVGVNDTLHLADIVLTNNVDLYAVWTKAITYSVTFNATMHGKTAVQFVKIVNQGEKASKPDTVITEAGYEVEKWCTDVDCNNEYGFIEKITKNITLYAGWKLIKYTIDYHLDDGVDNTGNLNDYTVKTDDIVFVDPTRTGYTFGGWYYDAAFVNKATQISTGTTGDITLYAKWTPITYTVKYLSGNTIPGVVSNDTKEYGEPLTLKDSVSTFSHAGCEQKGWSLSDNGEVAYAFGGEYTGNADLTLYPHWECSTYNLTYETDGGNKGNNPDTYTGPAMLGLNNGTYSGFYFGGWYREISFKNQVSNVQNITTDLTLYARWYNKVTYKPGSALSGVDAVVTNKNKGAHVTLKTSINKFTRQYYTLDGWSTNDGGEKAYELGTKYSENANLTLYPHWTANTHTITYNNVETSELPEGYPTTYTHESAVTLPIPSRNGYEFLGWFVDGEFNGEVVTGIPEGQTEDKVFFAKWSDAVEYSITYNLDDGTNDVDNPASYTVETPAFTLKDAVKLGYTFNGWFNESDVPVTTVAGGATGDIELTAQWTPVEYTITYENVNGATNDNATTYTIEQTVALNALEKDGFAFRGWFTNAQFEGNAATEISAGASGDTTFYAKWLEIFTITYAAGEGDGITGAVAAGTKTATEDATLSNDGFTREGYTQTGWKTEDGSVTYAMGATYTTDASVTLYPIWEVETYNIVYHNIEGATFETENPTSYTVEDGDIALNSPSKSGFNFLGWSLTENSTEYVDGVAAGSTGEAVFYANWEKVYPFLVNDFGAVKVYEDEEGKLTAKINTNSSEAVNIPSNISVDHVEFVRKFTVGVNSTIMLPFSIDTTKISGGSFKEFAYVDETIPKALFYNDVAGGIVRANTPYIFVPTSDTLIFNLGEGETVSLNTNDIVVPVSNTDGGKWQFRGVYSREEWESGDRQVWGYVSNTSSEVAKIGKFMRAGAGAYIDPMRGYLYNTQAEEQSSAPQTARRLLAKSSNLSAQTVSVSDGVGSIEVDFIEREVETEVETETVPEVEGTTVISKVNPISGGIKAVNGWFDMRGRKLNAKPTTKGIYYFNGKQVFVR